jgi:hypothetical protein
VRGDSGLLLPPPAASRETDRACEHAAGDHHQVGRLGNDDERRGRTGEVVEACRQLVTVPSWVSAAVDSSTENRLDDESK